MQQVMTPSHKYANIEPDNNESTLVTSSFQSGSPKTIHQDFSESQRGKDEVNHNTKQTNLRKKKSKSPINSVEDISLVSPNKKQYNVVLNNHQLPQFQIPIKRYGGIQSLLRAAENEAILHGFLCISKSNSQMILLKQLSSNFPDNLRNIFCSENKLGSQSRNCIIMVKQSHDGLIVKAVSGNLRVNEIVIEALSKVIQYNIENHQEEDEQDDTIKKGAPVNDFQIQYLNLNHDSHLEQDIYQNPYYLDAASVQLIYKYVKEAEIQKRIQSALAIIVNSLTSFCSTTHKKQLEKEVQKYKYIRSLMLVCWLNSSMMKPYPIQIIIQQDNKINRSIPTIKQPLRSICLSRSILLHSLFIYTNIHSRRNQYGRKEEIKKVMNPLSMMQFLEIKDKFSCLTSTQRAVYGGKLDQQIDPPYHKAIKELEKINMMKSPREKLKCIQFMHCIMKADAVEYNNIKEELLTMDDELPVIIYIMLMAEFQNQYAEIQFVDDFANTDQTIENERRVLTNLRVSLDYIANEWTL